MNSATTEKNIPDFPCEVTFKAIFRNHLDTFSIIRSTLEISGISPEIVAHESKNGKFISYTITAVFSSDETLKLACSNISSINGFMTMF
jgi:hypothetical protein